MANRFPEFKEILTLRWMNQNGPYEVRYGGLGDRHLIQVWPFGMKVRFADDRTLQDLIFQEGLAGPHDEEYDTWLRIMEKDPNREVHHPIFRAYFVKPLGEDSRFVYACGHPAMDAPFADIYSLEEFRQALEHYFEVPFEAIRPLFTETNLPHKYQAAIAQFIA